MRFNTFLNEKSILKFGDFDIAMEYVERKCQSFLEDWRRQTTGDEFLYRGMKVGPDISVNKARKDRQPLSTEPDMHKFIDDYLYEKYGIRGRSGAIFCTGYVKNASVYGTPRIIFPIGEYKILWSPKIYDLFLSGISFLSKDDIKEKLLDSYRTDGLGQAIRSKKEVMVDCDMYVAFHYKYTKRLIKYFT